MDAYIVCKIFYSNMTAFSHRVFQYSHITRFAENYYYSNH